MNSEVNKINVLDLFCGCGGFVDAGFNVIAGIDIWDVAINSYKKNNNHIGLCEDLQLFLPEKCQSALNYQNVDVIIGGPSCQGMSIAGKRDVIYMIQEIHYLWNS